MKKRIIVIALASVAAVALINQVPKYSIKETITLSELYTEYEDSELIAGFKFWSLPLNKYLVKPEYVDMNKVKIVKVKSDSPEDILYELLTYSQDFTYRVEQPYPYEALLKTKGGNCQALSLWLSKQLTHYGIKNSLYLAEGNTHMYNIVSYNNNTIKVDLSTREVSNG